MRAHTHQLGHAIGHAGLDDVARAIHVHRVHEVVVERIGAGGGSGGTVEYDVHMLGGLYHLPRTKSPAASIFA